jgi:hypothetical protein
MAHNLALSLKRVSPDIPIVLFASESLRSTIAPDLFHSVHTLPESDYRHSVTGRIEPAKAKCQAYRLGLQAGLSEFLFLDVDGVALSDISPLLDHLRGSVIATEVTGTGGKSDTINYSIWATNAQMWRHFDLAPDATLCGVQSSWMYFEKHPINDALQVQLDHYVTEGPPLGGFKMNWGNAIPDEFIYAGCLARMGLIPSLPPGAARRPIFFGHAKRRETPPQVEAQYHILSIYGGGDGKLRGLTRPQWLKMYDRTLSLSDRIWYSAAQVMGDKHANGRG